MKENINNPANKADLNEFRIDTQNDRLWWNGVEVDKKQSGRGKYGMQMFFTLDKDDTTQKSHWVNYSCTYAHEKVWVTSWYKKKLEDGTHINYKKKFEKYADIVDIKFTEEDEMIAIFDKKKQRNRWINKKEAEESVKKYGSK
jgi:hypothetical protein